MDVHCIKVKRRGVNYYTDYMERYFEKVAVLYGYHLVKKPAQADLICTTYISQPSENKWMTFVSGVFAQMTDSELECMAQQIGEAFKAESIIEPIDLNGDMSVYGSPYVWCFSKKYSAFDEPAYLTAEPPLLKINSWNTLCVSGRTYKVTALNIGGRLKGLRIEISYPCQDNKAIFFENAEILTYTKNKQINRLQINLDYSQVIDGRQVHIVELPEFVIPDGINIYSAKLSGKKKQDEADYRSVTLSFTPMGDNTLLSDLTTTILPL